MAPLQGRDLLKLIKENQGKSAKQLAELAGYTTTTKSGQKRVKMLAFQSAILQANNISLIPRHEEGEGCAADAKQVIASRFSKTATCSSVRLTRGKWDWSPARSLKFRSAANTSNLCNSTAPTAPRPTRIDPPDSQFLHRQCPASRIMLGKLFTEHFLNLWIKLQLPRRTIVVKRLCSPADQFDLDFAVGPGVVAVAFVEGDAGALDVDGGERPLVLSVGEAASVVLVECAGATAGPDAPD